MGDLMRLSDAKTRSICPENFTGEKGKGGMCPLEEGNAPPGRPGDLRDRLESQSLYRHPGR